MHDWWSPIIGTVTGFLAAWGVLHLADLRRRKLADAARRRALVAELRQAELVLSTLIFNLSIGTDNVADAVRELKVFLEVEAERILRVGILDLTAEQLEALRHLQGVSDHDAAEILRTLSPGSRARPLEVRVPVLDSLLANPPAAFGDVELQALGALRWQVHLLRDEAQLTARWLRLTSTTRDAERLTRTMAYLDGTRDSYRRRAIVAVQMIRNVLSMVKAGQGQRNRVAVMSRRARGRREPARPEAR